MRLFRNLFNTKSKSDKDQEHPESTERSKYMPDIQLPTDERFMLNFKNNGGKFLYCEDEREVDEAFDNILVENDWYEQEVCCFDENLRSKFKDYNLNLLIPGNLPFSFRLVST